MAQASELMIDDIADGALEDMECRMCHRAMVVSVEFVNAIALVADKIQHPPHVQILLISPVQFQLTVARDDDIRGSIRPDMEKRCEAVNRRLQFAYPLPFSLGKMSKNGGLYVIIINEKYFGGNYG